MEYRARMMRPAFSASPMAILQQYPVLASQQLQQRCEYIESFCCPHRIDHEGTSILT